VADCCDHGNEHSGSIDCGEFGKEQRDFGSSGTVDCRILRPSVAVRLVQAVPVSVIFLCYIMNVSSTCCWSVVSVVVPCCVL
jgi:hypothetical protein